jgi:hypothetical protein
LSHHSCQAQLHVSRSPGNKLSPVPHALQTKAGSLCSCFTYKLSPDSFRAIQCTSADFHSIHAHPLQACCPARLVLLAPVVTWTCTELFQLTSGLLGFKARAKSALILGELNWIRQNCSLWLSKSQSDGTIWPMMATTQQRVQYETTSSLFRRPARLQLIPMGPHS